jgi:ribose/xylose/arabinose/galactoside ABC-type transport system permease subunit
MCQWCEKPDITPELDEVRSRHSLGIQTPTIIFVVCTILIQLDDARMHGRNAYAVAHNRVRRRMQVSASARTWCGISC